jgi:hypothetical protein
VTSEKAKAYTINVEASYWNDDVDLTPATSGMSLDSDNDYYMLELTLTVDGRQWDHKTIMICLNPTT